MTGERGTIRVGTKAQCPRCLMRDRSAGRGGIVRCGRCKSYFHAQFVPKGDVWEHLLAEVRDEEPEAFLVAKASIVHRLSEPLPPMTNRALVLTWLLPDALGERMRAEARMLSPPRERTFWRRLVRSPP